MYFIVMEGEKTKEIYQHFKKSYQKFGPFSPQLGEKNCVSGIPK